MFFRIYDAPRVLLRDLSVRICYYVVIARWYSTLTRLGSRSMIRRKCRKRYLFIERFLNKRFSLLFHLCIADDHDTADNQNKQDKECRHRRRNEAPSDLLHVFVSQIV